MADGIKMFFKQDFVPRDADGLFLHSLHGSPVFCLDGLCRSPFGGVYQLGEYSVACRFSTPTAGLLLVFAMMSLGIYGVVLGGYASSNNYATLGGLRGAAR